MDLQGIVLGERLVAEGADMVPDNNIKQNNSGYEGQGENALDLQVARLDVPLDEVSLRRIPASVVGPDARPETLE